MPEKNNLFLRSGSSAVFDKKAFPALPQIESFAKVGRRADILVRSEWRMTVRLDFVQPLGTATLLRT